VQHELPIFGPPSEYAARASVAAARQGLQQELRRRLMRSPLMPDPALISRLATEVGLNADRLRSDMADPAIQAELDQTRALADVFGFVGTPGLVIGRTVLNGAVKAETINRILAAERKEQPLNC
jgi:protein-disulfide isomerase